MTIFPIVPQTRNTRATIAEIKNKKKKKVESAERLECQNKQIKLGRLQISRERNATRNLIRQSKTPIPEQIVQSKEIINPQEPNTSPLQSIVSKNPHRQHRYIPR